jgi:hypothetical protein
VSALVPAGGIPCMLLRNVDTVTGFDTESLVFEPLS